MGRKASSTLTAAELRLMKILWDRGSATVTDVGRETQFFYNGILLPIISFIGTDLSIFRLNWWTVINHRKHRVSRGLVIDLFLASQGLDTTALVR